jgi:hypothetical protein
MIERTKLSDIAIPILFVSLAAPLVIAGKDSENFRPLEAFNYFAGDFMGVLAFLGLLFAVGFFVQWNRRLETVNVQWVFFSGGVLSAIWLVSWAFSDRTETPHDVRFFEFGGQAVWVFLLNIVFYVGVLFKVWREGDLDSK